jgi:endo-alpha-N-acetylgalactosaminidase
MKVLGLLSIVFSALAASAACAAESRVSLESRSLAVQVDGAFPRIIQYRHKEDGSTLAAQTDPAGTILLNGQAAPYQIAFHKRSAAEGEYRIAFPPTGVTVTLLVRVAENVIELRVSDIEERGATKVKTLAFPNNALLTIQSSQPNAAIAALHCTSLSVEKYLGELREKIGALAAQPVGEDTGNYFFASAGKLAAGIASNNPVDIQRTAWKITETNGVKTCTAWCPVWFYREIDSETVDLPWVKVFVTPDRNGDGKADWQDAALVYRETMPMPFGHEFVRTTVGENIAMNFASGAQQPFLRILDNVKKAYLATDGLGQQVLIKGYTAEGHDSANSDYGGHYNERAGGLKDLTVLLDRAGAYNARIGVHINTSEVYPEAHRYKPEILKRDADGNLKGGWVWLDDAIQIDKRKDILSGNLFAALEQMRKELPKLDFVYVDTYWENGWPAWKIATKLKSMGLPMCTEGYRPLDPWSTWSHGRGGDSAIMRFLWYSDRDICDGSDALLRGGRGDDDGFMGWWSDFNSFVRHTFTRHLPPKYLQHFHLLRWEPGKEAVFSDGVKIARSPDNITITRNGRPVMVMAWGAYTRLFVPWDPKTEAKIYAWDDTEGNASTWELPPSWKRQGEAFLYRLTDEGRTAETRLPISAGKVTLKLEQFTPYVLYPEPAPRQQPLAWGEGSLVKDPGFDSHSFTFWKATGDPVIANDSLGNSRLLITKPAPAEVAQDIAGLEPGKTYAASVWVQVRGRRTASIAVKCGGQTASNFVARTNVRHGMVNDFRKGTNYQRMKVLFDVPAGVTTARIALRAEEGTRTTAVEFDDVRIVPTKRSPEAAKHWFWEDFENVDQGYGPFTCNFGMGTHLSEANPPYTHDVINGRYSLKTRDGKSRVARTLPCTIRFKPNNRYRLTCQTMGGGHFTVECKEGTVFNQAFRGNRSQVTGEFATTGDTETFLAFYYDEGDPVCIDDLAIDDLGPLPAGTAAKLLTRNPEDTLAGKLAGRAVLFEDRFDKPLAGDWTVFLSKKKGTSIAVADETLNIHAAANVAAFIERALPAGTTAVECRLTPAGDEGRAWGPGLCLLWSNGQAIRLNVLKPDGRFCINSTVANQAMIGDLAASSEVTLRIRLEADAVYLEAQNDDEPWQALGKFPRTAFPGAPAKVRVGKMLVHPAAEPDNFGVPDEPGYIGVVTVALLRVYGK